MPRFAATLAVAAFGWAVAVATTGGFTIRPFGIRLASHRVVPAALIAWLAAFVWYRAQSAARQDELSDALRRSIVRADRTIVASCAALAVVLGLVFGTHVAAGADAFGYLAQARLWTEGRLIVPASFGGWASWPLHEWAMLPLGFRPGLEPGTAVPTYAPGLPILMAAADAISAKYGAFVIVPLCGALMVWVIARLARHVGGAPAAVAAAILVGCSPPFLYQLVQPMTDVPVAACWLLAFVAALEGGWTGAFAAGLSASIALLIRPNLAPAIAPLLALTFVSAVGAARWRNAALFLAGVCPGVVLSAWNNTALYGSPIVSGYGPMDVLFSSAHVIPNLNLYGSWLVRTHTVFPLFGFAAPFVAAACGAPGKVVAWIAIGFVLVVLGCYLPYYEFDHWTYLRFLLPAIPLLLVYAATLTLVAMDRWMRHGVLAASALTLILMLWFLHTAVANAAFDLKTDFQTRAVQVGGLIDKELSPNAAFLCVLQSGSLRYYTDRDAILRFDWIRPEDLDEVLTWLRARKYAPYAILEPVEVDEFRSRFGAASRAGRVDWPPVREFENGTRVYDLTGIR